MLDRQKLLKRFSNSEEKFIFAKVIDQMEICLKRHICTFTDFLDPAKEIQYRQMLSYEESVGIWSFGGFEEAERKVIAFYPDYMNKEDLKFPISAISIKPLDKFSQPPSHREYLGSILGTGIERTKVGDILIFEEYAVAFVGESIADYVCNNLQKVSRIKVENKIVDLHEVQIPKKDIKQMPYTVASLRIDALISTAFHISRTKASDYIKAEKVSLNWVLVKSNSLEVKEGDVMTLRGHGRAKLLRVTGTTKKDRIGVIIETY